MPTLVTPLVNGFADAPNGSVEFYQTGTATLSSLVYSDANGITATTTHTLDASGRIVRYVNEIVDVVVKNSQGVTVAGPFTQVTDARGVRVENAMFTGPNVNGNGQVVAGGRTTLHSGLTLLRESFGADDGYIVGDDNVEYLAQIAAKHSARQTRSLATTLAGTSYTPNARIHTHVITHSSGASIAFANPSPGYTFPSAELLIVYINNTGGNRTPTWGTLYAGAPATAVATGTTAMYTYKSSPVLTVSNHWILVTTTPVTDAA